MLRPQLALVGRQSRLVEVELFGWPHAPQLGPIFLEILEPSQHIKDASLLIISASEQCLARGLDRGCLLLIMPGPDRLQALVPCEPWPQGWDRETVQQVFASL